MKINNKLLYLLSLVLMFSIGCEDEEAAAEAEATILLGSMYSLVD